MPVLLWWLTIQVLGFLALPVARLLFGALPDRGYAASKALGLLLYSYGVWLLVSLGFLQNTRPALIVALFLYAGAAVLLARRTSFRLRDLWQDQRALILVVEAIFGIALAGFALFRAYAPDITSAGGEKFMELAFINGVLRSRDFPPLDPWLSGHTINYYYFGYIMVGVLTQLTTVPAEVAFNVAVALIFALACTGSFGLAYNLAGVALLSRQQPEPKLRFFLGGALGLFFVMLAGNHFGTLKLVQDPKYATLDFYSGMGWNASRVIQKTLGSGPEQRFLDYTINEFPAFSFILGDLHPHVLALPFALLALTLALAWLVAPEAPLAVARRPRQAIWWLLGGGLLLGALYFLNSWDFPTYFGLALPALVLGIGRTVPGPAALRSRLWDGLAVAAGTAVAVWLLYLPFLNTFQPLSTGLGLVTVRTDIGQFLTIFGTAVWVAAVYVAGLAVQQWLPVPAPALPGAPRPARAGGRGQMQLRLGLVLGGTIAAGLLAVRLVPDRALLVLALAGAVLCATLAWERRAHPGDAFALLLLAAGAALVAGCEVLFIKDYFGPGFQRMNTVFKFYYQAWLLTGIAAAFGVLRAWELLGSGSPAPTASGPAAGRHVEALLARGAFALTLALLGASALVYPLVAGWARAEHFRRTPTLDGIAYWEGRYPGDLAAIRWLQQNVQGAPVILEAPGPAYSEFNRVSAFTGLPAVIGWDQHERLWRGERMYDEIARRQHDADQAFRTPQVREAQAFLEKYHVQYVYAGPLERQKYGPAVEKFAQFMDIVYQADGVTIYRRR
jgi:YYY domain-containing protein